ncbi:uncharacterized protein LOC105202801 [Solenopsis invicta]|nr:uncharacterized protein LOC105202801 [Solenopsis invicta]
MTDAGGSSSSGGTVPIKLLKNKRGQVKSQCTRYTSYLEEIDLQNTSLIELRQRLHKFNETWDVFNGIQASIEDIECEADYSASHDEERRLFEERYFAITSKLESLIEAKVGSTQALNLSHVPRFTREGTPATQGSSANEHLKLPRINLPTFAGSFEDWIPFRNMFQTMIHQNATLPNVQKMQYLIVSLKGEARDMVGSLEVSDENYSEAWEMLKERYDDTGLIIQKHIKALFEVPVIVKENHVLLRRALDNVLKHLRALKALRRPTEYWDDLIVYVIASRLDQKTSRAWETTVKRGEVPTLKQLSDFLSQHSKALEASARPVKVNSNSNSERGSQPRSTAVNVATTSSKCAYCSKEEHIIYKCKDFLDLEIEKRIQEARSRKLCLNCLRSTLHQARQCSIGPCRKCNKRHNTLLHLESTVTKKPESKSEDASSAEDGKVVATSINHVSFKQGKQVLLATATVKVNDSKGNQIIGRALLDSGLNPALLLANSLKGSLLNRFL